MIFFYDNFISVNVIKIKITMLWRRGNENYKKPNGCLVSNKKGFINIVN
jgi:hypothetical protein